MLRAYIQYTYRGILLIAKVDKTFHQNSQKKHTILSLKNFPLFNFKLYCAIFLSKFKILI